MRHATVSRLALVLVLGVTLGAQTKPKEPTPDAMPSISCEKAIATQNRINRYFHGSVVPTLGACWAGIAGSGTVQVTFGFKRDKELWVPAAAAVRSTTLSAADADRALGCLKASIKGTAFAVEDDDKDADAYNVHWSFPVPMPRNLDEAAARMNVNTGGSRCGGSEGPKEACWSCWYQPVFGWSWCSGACVGFSSCSSIESGCFLKYPKCATGSVFGNTAGLVKY
jgi:hypothetical protein